MSQRKSMKTVIALEKNHVFHRENIAYQKKIRPYLKNTEPSLRVLHMTDRLRQNTQVNLELAFARLISIHHTV